MQFKDIIGQEEIKKRLIKTVKDNRISHAQLFLGPEGNEKLALAIAYAQYINCTNKQDNDSCGECPSCKKYNKLIHPDLHFIYPVANTKEIKKATSIDFLPKWRNFLIKNKYHITLNEWLKEIGIEKKQGIIKTEDCNNIIKTLSYKSFEAEYKVMIIWMAEKLYHSAAPKILKILEEPPEKTLFILISEDQEQIISTIISRTQLIKIPKIKDEDIYKAIKDNFDLREKDISRIINLSGGNYKEALRLIEQSPDERYNIDNFIEWMRLCYKSDFFEINKFVIRISKIGREKQKNFLINSLKFLRLCLIYNYDKDKNKLKFEGDDLTFIRNFSPFINSSNILQITDECDKAVYYIERNANPSILFMDLSIKLIYLLKKKP
ncbi:MAG: DNA polymerase III subunit delta [Bacteroidales bacterium]|nr:DNA polymerase III subunit delta [Bacteroidales bacterium]